MWATTAISTKTECGFSSGAAAAAAGRSGTSSSPPTPTTGSATKSATPPAGSAWTSRTAGMPIGRQCSNGTAEQATSRQAKRGTSIRPYRRELSPRSAASASTSPADRSSRAPICRPTTAQQTTPPRYSSSNSDPTSNSLRAVPILRVPGSSREPEPKERQLDARRRMHHSLKVLGGLSGPAGSCLWHVVGLQQRSVRAWAFPLERPCAAAQGVHFG